MSLTRLIAGLCLALLLCTPLGAQENAAPAPKPKAEKVLASGGKAQPGAKAESKDAAKDAAKDALDAEGPLHADSERAALNAAFDAHANL